MSYKYPIYQPDLSGNEEKYVVECLHSTWISSKGKYISQFEGEFAKYLEVKYATAVSNGTVAIHLALVALGITQGDEVIVPSFTYIASVNAISYTNAKPVFVDSKLDSWQIDIADVKRKITAKTKAIMAVHLYGHPCEMEDLVDLCREKNIYLIEDCAEAFGSTYKNKYVGTFGDIATFSFFGNKTITTGEGGMVVTNDETLYDRTVHLKGQGLAKHRQYWHDTIGFNYRMTNICAAIGLAQLERADEFIAKKIQIGKWYEELLEDSRYTFHKAIGDVKHTYWMCSLLCESPEERDVLREHLQKNRIETRPTFYPVHTMPMYSQKFERHKVAEYLGWRGINLPSYPSLQYEDISFIVKTMLTLNVN